MCIRDRDSKQVTELRTQSRGRKRINVYLDEEFAFSLDPEVVLRYGLKVGYELDNAVLKELTDADNFRRCLDAAMLYLGYRPRSEAEMRQRLAKRGFNEQSIGSALARLKELGMLDDAEFARFWRDSRQDFSPRSRAMTRIELKRKGVAEEIIGQALSDVSDEDSAYRAARERARRLIGSDYQTFRRRLGEYLKRRGFGYGIIKKVVGQLWQETEESTV